MTDVGAPDSLLDWEIESTPDWGEWSFEPNGGTDLTGWDPVTVSVEVVAPTEEDKFTGELKIVNIENPDDYEIIAVTLSTPRNRGIFLNFFEQILNQFPMLKILFGF